MHDSTVNIAAAATRSLPRPEPKTSPWSPEEDKMLRDHVMKHGPAAWNSLRSRGLNHAASTCRRRWAGHIDPDRKAGLEFSSEEERKIVALHDQIGNKWETIGKSLPGRTGYDVKNFWRRWETRRRASVAAMRNESLVAEQLRKAPAPTRSPALQVSSNARGGTVSVGCGHSAMIAAPIPVVNAAVSFPRQFFQGMGGCALRSSTNTSLPPLPPPKLLIGLVPPNREEASRFTDGETPSGGELGEQGKQVFCAAPTLAGVGDVKRPESPESLHEMLGSSVFDFINQRPPSPLPPPPLPIRRPEILKHCAKSCTF